jgi:hypothetical protein
MVYGAGEQEKATKSLEMPVTAIFTLCKIKVRHIAKITGHKGKIISAVTQSGRIING